MTINHSTNDVSININGNQRFYDIIDQQEIKENGNRKLLLDVCEDDNSPSYLYTIDFTEKKLTIESSCLQQTTITHLISKVR